VHTVSRLSLKIQGTYHLLIMAIAILNSISVIFGVKKTDLDTSGKSFSIQNIDYIWV
jgi:hypothetical protein